MAMFHQLSERLLVFGSRHDPSSAFVRVGLRRA